MQTGEKIKVNDDAGKVHTLNQTFPMNLRTHTAGPSMVTKQLCNLMAKEVTGAGSQGTLESRFNKGKKTTQVEKSGTSSNATAAFIAKLFAREIDKAKGGEKGEEEYTPEKVEDRLLKVKEEETPTVAKVAKEIGVNEYTPMPEIGEAYVTYSSGNYGAKGKWNYHWGGVIGTTGSDIITLENYARSGELQDVYDKAGKVVDFSPGLSQQAIDTRYFFKMYGVQKIKNEKGKVVGTQDRSFHSESVLTDDFVNPVTILKGKKGAKGEGQEIGDKVPIADEYVRDLRDSVGQNWKNIPVQKLEQNWAKLPTLVSRIADAFEQQKKLDPRFTDKLDKRKKSFLEEIKAVMPDLGGPGRKRKKLSREKMLPYLRQAMGIIDTYTTSFGISG